MVSVFTPSHDGKFLPEVYKSLLAQTDPGWEWCVLFNNDCEPMRFGDPRAHTSIAYHAPQWVGPLKAAACEMASGDILLELDHDDLLMPTAVEEVRRAFEDPEIGFAYSNTVHSDANFGKTPRFDEASGWRYREVGAFGHTLDEYVAFPPTPESVSRIWFAPDHLRAYRRSVYEKVGGYARDMRVLDDMDLMCKMYLEARFAHIDKPLYVYRVTGENTWLRYNKEIQENVYRLYDQYVEPLAERWCERAGLRKVELGGRMAAKAGFETVDAKAPADMVCDLDGKWPFEDSSVGVIRAMDVFEHLGDPIHTMREASRVLAPGGWLFCQVPSTDGRGAWQDPTHRSFWNQNSFLYYTDKRWAGYIDTPVRFQAPRLYTTDKDANQVCWARAHLISLKDGYRPCGQVGI
jgi:SAM-dependent methyltransferase